MRTSLLLVTFSILFLSACSKPEEPWIPASKGMTVSPYKSDPVNGKRYLDVIYENFSMDTVQKIRYELITLKGNHEDTVLREIEPEKILLPGIRHLVPRPIGEPEADFDGVHAGKVWIIKN